jgi:hypothetical protein
MENVRQRKPQLAGLLLNRKGEESTDQSTEVGVLSVWFMTASFKQTSSVAFAPNCHDSAYLSHRGI